MAVDRKARSKISIIRLVITFEPPRQRYRERIENIARESSNNPQGRRLEGGSRWERKRGEGRNKYQAARFAANYRWLLMSALASCGDYLPSRKLRGRSLPLTPLPPPPFPSTPPRSHLASVGRTAASREYLFYAFPAHEYVMVVWKRIVCLRSDDIHTHTHTHTML